MGKWPNFYFRFALIYGDTNKKMYRWGGDGLVDEVCARKFEGDGLGALASPPKMNHYYIV